MSKGKRRLVSFWAGGSVSKKRGGKAKVKVVNKAKGGMPGAVAGMKHRAAVAAVPANPMEGRLTTGIVGRRPGKRPMPTIGAALGNLGGPLGPIR